jgi:hypothetical protein
LSGSSASVAHLGERPSRKRKATGSRPVRGSKGGGTDPASDGGVKDNARRSPSRPPAGGCSSVRESAASPSPRSPVRTRSSTPDRPSPIGKRRHAQTVEVQGSSPWGGTQVTRRAKDDAALCPGKASRLVTAPVPKTGEQRELPCGFNSRPFRWPRPSGLRRPRPTGRAPDF